jgi:hypothetical protein
VSPALLLTGLFLYLALLFLVALLGERRGKAWVPRQFHVSVVENVNPGHLPLAAWAFPLYLLINLPVLPLALLGRIHFPQTNPDLFVLALVAPLARERGVLLEGRLPHGAVQALTDRDRVLQVLLNLLQNAIRHAHSRVILELKPSGREAFFYVQDDGPGVPEEKRPWLFEPFQSFAGGTGLGLYLARRLAEALGGRVFLEAGEGARFAFALPLEVDHADPGGG